VEIIEHRWEEPAQLRVAAYCRVSTNRSSQEESYETQQSYYRKYISDNPEWTFAGIYADEKSGTSAEKRPGFQAMMQDAFDGKMDLIVVKSLSRFSRNLGLFENSIKALKEKGVRIWFERENLYSDSEQTKLILSIMAALAEQESYSISENIKWGQRERQRQGIYNIGNNRVLGYDSKEGKPIPNNDAWIVKAIFEMFIEGHSYRTIVRKLETMGAKSIRGNRLGPSCISYIVNNEIYVGDRLLQKKPPMDFFTKKRIPNTSYDSYYLSDDHEGIIDRATWEKAQKRLKDNRFPIAGSNDTRKNHHYLYGYVICGECGSYGTRRTIRAYCRKGEPHFTYKAWICSKHRADTKKCDNSCSVRETDIVERICEEMGWKCPENDELNPYLLYESIDRIVVSETGEIKIIKREQLTKGERNEENTDFISS